MSDAYAVVRVPDPEDALAALDAQGVDAAQFSSVAIGIPLDLSLGDAVVAKKSGHVQVVQDAMVGRINDGKIVEIREP